MNRYWDLFSFQIFCWIFAYTLFSVSLYFLLLNMQDVLLEAEMPMNFWGGIVMSIISGIVVGMVLGGIDLFLKNRDEKSILSLSFEEYWPLPLWYSLPHLLSNISMWVVLFPTLLKRWEMRLNKIS